MDYWFGDIPWHKGEEVPDPLSGSFFILKKDWDIAEVEYRASGIERYFHDETKGGGYWFQYRWSSAIRPKDVLAWCRMTDCVHLLETPFIEQMKMYGKKDEPSLDRVPVLRTGEIIETFFEVCYHDAITGQRVLEWYSTRDEAETRAARLSESSTTAPTVVFCSVQRFPDNGEDDHENI